MKAATRLGIDQDKTWYVVRANIKCEEKAERNLKDAGFDAYLPIIRSERHNKRTHTYRLIERPLMLRYLFVGLAKGAEHFGFVRSCEGVESILGDQGNHPIAVPAGLVERIFVDEFNLVYDDTRAARIARKEEAKTKKATIEMTFPAGKTVDVLDGPFASFMGEVEEVTSRGTVKALVAVFGRLASVEFEPAQLSPAKKRRAA